MPLPSPFTVLRKNWKFSLIYVPSTSGLLYWFYDYTLTKDLMSNACKRASKLGDQKLKPLAQPRHITVILNPAAGNRKCKKLYTKWVEPLFHLAGIKVSLVETESPTQVLELMKVMSNCDGVAIVGGDGTVNQAINGLLVRPDRARAARDLPIGVMPTGQHNSIARYIYQDLFSYRNQKEFLINSALMLVDCCQTKYDVLKIDQVDSSPEGERRDPVYAFRDVRYGKFQSNYVKLNGFLLYQHYIRPYWLQLKALVSSKFQSPKIASISYTEPCDGCSRCYERHKLRDSPTVGQNDEPTANRRWWSIVPHVNNGKSKQTFNEAELEESKRDNPDCGHWRKIDNVSNITDFRASMMGEKQVRLSLGVSGGISPSLVLETQDVKLRIDSEIEETNNRVLLSTTTSTGGESADPKATEKTVDFLIDGQPSPAKSIEICALKEAITVFAGSPRLIVD